MRSLLKVTFNDWYEDRAQRMGAALAYYTIFALTPGLVILMALAGLLLGPGAESQIIEQIRELIGKQGATAIEATIRSARKETLGATGTALALIPLVFGIRASAVPVAPRVSFRALLIVASIAVAPCFPISSRICSII